ncbi:MAG: hypothetical protein ABJH72_24085 [Reichenbachiella sp.]|uniref:hypothetical protein n=1 Tax=Reichenbachiella sp. TaxID=2184521 RepID=UPI0032643F6C
MKTIRIVMLALVCSMMAYTPAEAQVNKKPLKKEIKKKAVKEARKEAKKYSKQGYTTAPGALPMAKQIETAWMRQYEVDEEGFPLYIVASGNSVANTQSAAKLQATELAKLELAGSISTQVAALIENSISNQQLNAEEAASVTKTVAASKNIIAQELGRSLPLFEIYRTLKNKNVEVTVRMAYNTKKAMEVARKTLSQKLESETSLAHEKLEKLLKF